jgi:adenylate cyclase
LPKLVDAARSALASSSSPSGITASPGAAATVSRQPTRWLAAIAAITVAALGYVLVDKTWLSKRGDVQRPSAMATPTSPANSTTGLPISDKSVAVLPFVDMSEKKDQEYFSDGLSEELIDRLAHAADLKVIARTSSFQFKGKNDDMRTIGHKLGVANLLEGSVRTSGNAIRVTAQLISVTDGAHRWSESYDRKTGDIFKVQDEIADAVVAALKATMAALPAGARAHSANIDSYNEVLRGRYFQNRETKEDSDRALAAFRQAIKLDPDNAEAWVELAFTYNGRGLAGWMPPLEAFAEARRAVDKAMLINPNLALAHDALSALEWNYNRDFAASEREYHRSLELDPSRVAGSMYDGYSAFASGQPEKAVSVFQRAREVNPLDTWTLGWLAEALWATNSLQEAESVERRILELSPNASGAYCFLGEIRLAQHEPEAALAIMRKETDESSRMTCMPDALWILGQKKEADAMLAEVQSRFPNSLAYVLATCYAFRGDKDAAFKWLDRAYENREPQITMIKGFPELRTLRSDPRFEALLRRLKLPK